MRARVLPGVLGLVVVVVMSLLSAPAHAAEWSTVSSRSLFRVPSAPGINLDLSAAVQKSGLKRRMYIHNSTGENRSVSVWRKQEGKSAVRVATVTVYKGKGRYVYWTTGRCRGEVAAGVTYHQNSKYDTSYPRPMKSAAKRC